MRGIFGINNRYDEKKDTITLLDEIFSVAPMIVARFRDVLSKEKGEYYYNRLGEKCWGEPYEYTFPFYNDDGEEISIDESDDDPDSPFYGHREKIDYGKIFEMLRSYVASFSEEEGALHPIRHLISFCQNLCQNYKYPLCSLPYENSKWFINQEIDQNWHFDKAVEKYLSLQYLYWKTLHHPPIELTKLLKEFSFSTPQKRTINLIAGSFRSQKEKRLAVIKDKADKKEIYDKTISEVKEIIKQAGLNVTAYEMLLDGLDKEEAKYDMNQWVKKTIVWKFNSKDKKAASNKKKPNSEAKNMYLKNYQKEYIKIKAKHAFRYDGFIGNFLFPSWKYSLFEGYMKWESIYDFMVVNGIFLRDALCNPFSYITNMQSFDNFMTNPVYDSTNTKFITGFIPSKIILSKQKKNTILVSHYILERITNLNLINEIMAKSIRCINYEMDTLYSFHKVCSIVDDISILAKYPLVSLRRRFLLYWFGNAAEDFHGMSSKLNKNYIDYLIRYHIYFYLPLISSLFRILLEYMENPFNYTDFEVEMSEKELFEGDNLEPVIRYDDFRSDLKANALRFDNQLESFAHIEKTVKNNHDTKMKYAQFALDYIKKRVYYSFYEEMSTFCEFDFIETYKEFGDKTMTQYIHEMDYKYERFLT